MTDTDFFNQELFINNLLFSIYDVDEFVLREINQIRSNPQNDIWGVCEAKRYSCEITLDENGKCEEYEVSTEYYLSQTELGYDNCFSTLNYKDFQDNFPLGEFENWYGSDWLITCHYNTVFLPSILEWIEVTEGDESKKMKIEKIIRKLKQSHTNLVNIEHNTPLNEIQKTVIRIYIQFDITMLVGIRDYFIKPFPEIFNTKDKKELSKKSIIGSLISKGFEDKFYQYENKLVSRKFLSEDRNKWLKKSADLVRLYNYLEKKEVINRAYENNSKGIKLLRELYDFFENTSIDVSRNKRLKQNTPDRVQFHFLDNF